ncbi:MAG: serine/threonine protein kinase [Acidobacteria bacterium]|nr:serine/threonine protein kinase [Acidobacteriota bacterium]
MSKNNLESFEYSSLLGKTIGDDYRIEKILGLGGMGAVFYAKQLSSWQDVALKVILPNKATDTTLVQRFLREARAGLLLSHPNIVKTYKYSKTADGLLFIVMEYVKGETLQNHLQAKGRLSLEKTLEFLKQLSNALETAHKHKVLHRDLKPENILIAKLENGLEIAKLTDFGIAKILSSEQGKTSTTILTGTGQVIGTPKYMSPEQLLGLATKHTTDIYSLGLIVYRMLTGSTPLEFEKKEGAIFKVTQDLAPISQKFSFLPIDFDPIFKKVLNRDSNARYQRAKDFFNDFAFVASKYPDLVIPPLNMYNNEEASITITPTVLQSKTD